MCAERGGGIEIKTRSFLRRLWSGRGHDTARRGRRCADQEDEVAALGKDIVRDWRRWSRRERWVGIAIRVLALLSVPAAVLFERDAGIPITTQAIAGPGAVN